MTGGKARAEDGSTPGFAELGACRRRGRAGRGAGQGWASLRAASIAAFGIAATLLEAMLTGGSAAASPRSSGRPGRRPHRAERLRGLIHLYSERTNTQAMAIELAVRQWARTDDMAAAAAARVDAARLHMSASSIAPLGLRPRKPTRRPSCSIGSSSARACCFSSAARASARSWWRSRPASWLRTKTDNAAGTAGRVVISRVAKLRQRKVQAAPFSFLLQTL